MLQVARQRGATHVLTLDGDEVYADEVLGFCRRLMRITSLHNLRGNGLEWGKHGFVETGRIHIQSSPHTLWLPGMWYLHFQHHPRSALRRPGDSGWTRPVRDLGSEAIHGHVHLPAVLLRQDGPDNPTLAAWGMGRLQDLAPVG